MVVCKVEGALVMELSSEEVWKSDFERRGGWNRVRSSRLNDCLWRAWAEARRVWEEMGFESCERREDLWMGERRVARLFCSVMVSSGVGW